MAEMPSNLPEAPLRRGHTWQERTPGAGDWERRDDLTPERDLKDLEGHAKEWAEAFVPALESPGPRLTASVEYTDEYLQKPLRHLHFCPRKLATYPDAPPGFDPDSWRSYCDGDMHVRGLDSKACSSARPQNFDFERMWDPPLDVLLAPAPPEPESKPIEVTPWQVRQSIFFSYRNDSEKKSLRQIMAEFALECPDDPLADEPMNVLQAVAIPEGAGKVRIITKQNSHVTYICYPMQRVMHRELRRHAVFSLIGEDFRVSSLDLAGFVIDDEVLSGDYDGATNRLVLDATRRTLEGFLQRSQFSDFEKATALDSLLSGILTFPSCKDSHGDPLPEVPPVILRRGQMMGNVLSFPLLCVINLICYWMSYERHYGFCRWEDLPCRINGDDLLARTCPEHYEEWLRSIARVGFKPSAGKNLVSRHIAIVNSQPIVVEKGKLEILPYVNLPVLLGRKSSKQGEIRDLAQAHNTLLHTCRTPAVTMPHFFTFNHAAIYKDFPDTNLFNAPLLGGAGFESHKYIPARWAEVREIAQRREQVHLGLLQNGQPTSSRTMRNERFWPVEASALGPYACPLAPALTQQLSFLRDPVVYHCGDVVVIPGEGTFAASDLEGCLAPADEDFSSRDWRPAYTKVKVERACIGSRWKRVLGQNTHEFFYCYENGFVPDDPEKYHTESVEKSLPPCGLRRPKVTRMRLLGVGREVVAMLRERQPILLQAH
jgi:hypothetical protein